MCALQPKARQIGVTVYSGGRAMTLPTTHTLEEVAASLRVSARTVLRAIERSGVWYAVVTAGHMAEAINRAA